MDITEAAANGKLDLTQAFTPTATQAEKDEALCLAVGGGHLEIIKHLVDAGADKSKIDYEDYRAAADFSPIPPKKIREFVEAL